LANQGRLQILPWQAEALLEWAIVGMNHYFVKGERRLFVAMAKDGKIIKAEGVDSVEIWRSLVDAASKITQTKSIEWREPDETTPVDTPVWVRDFADHDWNCRKYAKSGHAYWKNGSSTTPLAAADDTETILMWHQIVLANPDDPYQPPPLDWAPQSK